MSRATRRQQQRAKRSRKGSAQDAVPKAVSTATRPQRPQAPASGGGGSGGVVSGFRFTWATDIISELQKVTWPSAADTRYLTIVVLVVATAFGVFLGGVDLFFNWLIQHTLVS